MNENLNLVEILKGCPRGTKLYSSVYGEVEFDSTTDREPFPIIVTKGYHNYRFSNYGRLYLALGECVLFPSKDQRDWSKFERFWDKPKVEKFDVNTLQPFDKVLAKDGHLSEWTCTFFSHMANDVPFPVYCSGGCFKVCIPYNKETKHLVGTNEDCPEYYKWWEE